MAQLVEMYPDEVTVAYRHLPLNSIHPNAQKAAEASEAAGAQGAFWEYHDALYATQGSWNNLPEEEAFAFFVDLADGLDLDTAAFAKALEEGTYAAYVTAVTEEASNLGMNSTPSVIFNGLVATGQAMPPIDISIWDTIVQLELLADRQYDAPPEMVIDPTKQYVATVEMASGDTFMIELFTDIAPLTVNNFVFLAQEGWFDGVTFHRVLPGFVAQTGDPTGSGMGGPGYFIPNEIDPNVSHDQAGIVAMANSGPNQNGSQWYITLDNVSQLDGSYTIFGRISDGLDVVQALAPRDPSVDPSAPPGDEIVSVTIEEK